MDLYEDKWKDRLDIAMQNARRDAKIFYSRETTARAELIKLESLRATMDDDEFNRKYSIINSRISTNFSRFYRLKQLIEAGESEVLSTDIGSIIQYPVRMIVSIVDNDRQAQVVNGHIIQEYKPPEQLDADFEKNKQQLEQWRKSNTIDYVQYVDALSDLDLTYGIYVKHSTLSKKYQSSLDSSSQAGPMKEREKMQSVQEEIKTGRKR